MSFFNLFKKKDIAPQVNVRDMIWMHNDGKMQGGLNMLLQHPDATFIAWFPETQQQWQHFFEKQNISAPIYLVRGLNIIQLAGKPVFILEHYPLATKEVAFFESLHRTEITVFSALADPLFIHFGGYKITAMMQKMGMKDHETIEHTMVSKSLKNAQLKLENKVLAEQSAHSMQEWFSKNIEGK